MGAANQGRGPGGRSAGPARPCRRGTATARPRARPAAGGEPPAHRWGRWCLPRAANRSCRRSEEHTSELQSQSNLVCRLLLEKKKKNEVKTNIYEGGTIRLDKKLIQ